MHGALHASTSVKEEHIDRVAHPHSVDAVAGLEQQALARTQRGAPQEPSHPFEHAASDGDPLGNLPPVLHVDCRQVPVHSAASQLLQQTQDRRAKHHDEERRKDEEDQREQHLEGRLHRGLLSTLTSKRAHMRGLRP